MHDVLEQFDVLRRAGRPVALATVVGIEGGSSKRIGARLWVTDEAETYGSLTVGGCVDGRARDEAHYVLDDGQARRIDVELGEEGLDFGMSCAGTVEVYIERIDLSREDHPFVLALEGVRRAVSSGRSAVLATPLADDHDAFVVEEGGDTADLLDAEEPTCTLRPGTPDVLYASFVPPRVLVVVGAAPIARPLVRLGKMLGYRVLMVDGKEERLTPRRFPDADELLSGIPSEICGQLELDRRSAVVLTAHDYRYEVPVLKEVLRRETGYVGFVASRRRGGAVLDFLASSGVDEVALKRVHVPVGLDIGAMTPAEIAVSIMSEVLAERSGTSCMPLVSLDDLAGVASA